MKKLLVIALSAIMVLAFAAVSMAAVEITGEVDATYKAITDTTIGELGLYIDAPINDQVSVYFGFWGEAGHAMDIDDANATFAVGEGSLQVGYGKYDFCGLDILGDNGFFDNSLFSAKEPPVSILFSTPVAEGMNVKVNYFRGQGDARVDEYGLGFAYDVDAVSASIDYFKSSDEDVEASYVLNGAYKLSDEAKVYGLYANTGVEDFDTFFFIGGEVTFGQLTAQLEYCAVVPEILDDLEVNPVGYKLSYAINDNASLTYKRDVNTAPSTNSVKDTYNDLVLVVSF